MINITTEQALKKSPKSPHGSDEWMFPSKGKLRYRSMLSSKVQVDFKLQTKCYKTQSLFCSRFHAQNAGKQKQTYLYVHDVCSLCFVRFKRHQRHVDLPPPFIQTATTDTWLVEY